MQHHCFKIAIGHHHRLGNKQFIRLEQRAALTAFSTGIDFSSRYFIFGPALKAAQRAIRTAVHKSFGVAPGSLIFNRDMLLNVPVIVDWQRVNERRFVVATRNNANENRKRRYYNYQVGDEVLILSHQPTKMGAKATGPFTITQVL